MSLTELHDKRGRLVTEARSALEEIKNNTDESRAAELEARHDKIMAEFDKIDATIKREEKVAEAERRAEEVRAKQRPIPQDGETRGQDKAESPEYRMVFAKVVCGLQDDLTNEERAVLRQGATKFEARAQTAGTTTAGGFTVPTELATFIDRAMKA